MKYVGRVMALAILMVIGCEAEPEPLVRRAVDVGQGPVTIEVATAKGTQTITVDDVASGATVESVMRSIDDVEIVITGSGRTAFLNQIGDLETAGGEGWSYKVDGEHVHEGIGTQTLQPPTTITWSYGSYEG